MQLRHTIEIAVRADGRSPAGEFLALLKSRMLVGDPDTSALPSDAQLGDYHKFLAACRHLAEFGEPKYRGQVNYLTDGIWEFKVGSKRLSWFDTDGRGASSSKTRIQYRDESPYPDSEFWFFPDFDQVIRLGHAFIKRGQRTDVGDLDQCILTREEDLRYDEK